MSEPHVSCLIVGSAGGANFFIVAPAAFELTTEDYNAIVEELKQKIEGDLVICMYAGGSVRIFKSQDDIDVVQLLLRLADVTFNGLLCKACFHVMLTQEIKWVIAPRPILSPASIRNSFRTATMLMHDTGSDTSLRTNDPPSDCLRGDERKKIIEWKMKRPPTRCLINDEIKVKIIKPWGQTAMESLGEIAKNLQKLVSK